MAPQTGSDHALTPQQGEALEVGEAGGQEQPVFLLKRPGAVTWMGAGAVLGFVLLAVIVGLVIALRPPPAPPAPQPGGPTSEVPPTPAPGSVGPASVGPAMPVERGPGSTRPRHTLPTNPEADPFLAARTLYAKLQRPAGKLDEASIQEALNAAVAAVAKQLAEQPDYAALTELEDKCAGEPLRSMYAQAVAEYELRGLDTYAAARAKGQEQAQKGDWTHAREALERFVNNEVPPVAAAAKEDLAAFAAQEETAKERAARQAAEAALQRQRLSYELYAELLEATADFSIARAQKALADWRARPDTKALAGELTAAETEVKWFDERCQAAARQLVAQKSTMEYAQGTRTGRGTAEAFRDGQLFITEGGTGGPTFGISLKKLNSSSLLNALGWTGNGLDAARFLFWRGEAAAAVARLEAPEREGPEKEWAARLALVRAGKERFSLPAAPKDLSVAIAPGRITRSDGLPALGVHSVAVNIAWTPVAAAKKYRIERKVGTGEFEKLEEQERDVVETRDEKAPLGVTLTYRVLAVNDGGATPSAEKVLTTPVQRIHNVVPDGGFETPELKGWRVSATAAAEPETGHSGQVALAIHGKGYAECTLQVVKVKAVYDVSGWLKLAGEGGVARVRVTSTSRHEVLGSSGYFSPKNTAIGAWTPFQFSFTANVAGTHDARLALEVFAAGKQGKLDVFFDDIVVSE